MHFFPSLHSAGSDIERTYIGLCIKTCKKNIHDIVTLKIVINILLVIGGLGFCFPFPLAPGFAAIPFLFFGAGSAKRRLIQLMIKSFQIFDNIRLTSK